MAKFSPQITSHNRGPTPDHLRSVLAELVAGGATLPPERELVEQLGVPRSRLRRVLAKMRFDGLLPPAQVGRRATREDDWHTDALARLANPTDVIELRLILEPQFARLAAVRASALEIGRIKRAATSSPNEDYGTTDLNFHLEIANASRNALGREIYNILRLVGADSRVHPPSLRSVCPNRREMRDAEHRRIAQAISERNPERAEECMKRHLARVQSIIMESISSDHIGMTLAPSGTAGE